MHVVHKYNNNNNDVYKWRTTILMLVLYQILYESLQQLVAKAHNKAISSDLTPAIAEASTDCHFYLLPRFRGQI